MKILFFILVLLIAFGISGPLSQGISYAVSDAFADPYRVDDAAALYGALAGSAVYIAVIGSVILLYRKLWPSPGKNTSDDLDVASQKPQSTKKNESSENESSYEKLKFERNQAKNHNEAVEVDGAQAQSKMQDEVPASGIEIQKQEIFENDEQAQNSENELELKGPADIDVESERFEKAQAAIEYVPKVADAWRQVEDLPEQFRLEFLKSLDADTKQDVQALVVSILSDHERSERPYENPELNDAFEEAKLLGEEALAEFTRVIDLLGEPEDIPEFLEKIKDKFASAELYNQLEIAMRALDVKGMISGLRALGYEVSNDFNGKYTDYRVLKDQRVHVLSGAGHLRNFVKNIISE